MNLIPTILKIVTGSWRCCYGSGWLSKSIHIWLCLLFISPAVSLICNVFVDCVNHMQRQHSLVKALHVGGFHWFFLVALGSWTKYCTIQNFSDFIQTTNLVDNILANIWLRIFRQVEIDLLKFCTVWYTLKNAASRESRNGINSRKKMILRKVY